MKQKPRIPHIKILSALLRDCKQSDREISKHADVSQPTVTRARQKLESMGIIKAYMAIPDYVKLGFTVGAIITGEFHEPAKIPNGSIILAAPIISGTTNLILITVHKTFQDYEAFLNKIKSIASNLTLNLLTTRGLEIKPVRLEA